MSMSIVSTVEPITLAQAWAQVRRDSAGSDDTAFMQRAITAARQMAEHRTAKRYANVRWQSEQSVFPAGSEPMVIAVPAVREVISVGYVDGASAAQTMPPEAYTVVPGEASLTITPVAPWPGPATGVVVVVEQGPAQPEDLGADARNWMLLQVGAIDAHRSAFVTGRTVEALPGQWVDGLLDSQRPPILA